MSLAPGRRLRTRVAGVFLFLPLLARVHFEHLVSQASYPGSTMVPATSALLSLLVLKLLDKERRSHINDFNFDEAVGLFAGLNVPPKKSYATDYSYRTVRDHQQKLLSGWIGAVAPVLFRKPTPSPWTFTRSRFGAMPPGWTNTISPSVARPGPCAELLRARAREPGRLLGQRESHPA